MFLLIKKEMEYREERINAEAYLWNGKQKLPGKLVLTNTHLEFLLQGFEESLLNWHIELDEIESAKDFLVFNIARQGLRIISNAGKSDLFVLENVEDLGHFFRELNKKKD